MHDCEWDEPAMCKRENQEKKAEDLWRRKTSLTEQVSTARKPRQEKGREKVQK